MSHEYKFEVGDQETIFRLEAVIEATSPEEALATLQGYMIGDVDLTPAGYAATRGYAQIRISPARVGLHHIVAVDGQVVAPQGRAE